MTELLTPPAPSTPEARRVPGDSNQVLRESLRAMEWDYVPESVSEAEEAMAGWREFDTRLQDTGFLLEQGVEEEVANEWHAIAEKGVSYWHLADAEREDMITAALAPDTSGMPDWTQSWLRNMKSEEGPITMMDRFQFQEMLTKRLSLDKALREHEAQALPTSSTNGNKLRSKTQPGRMGGARVANGRFRLLNNAGTSTEVEVSHLNENAPNTTEPLFGSDDEPEGEVPRAKGGTQVEPVPAPKPEPKLEATVTTPLNRRERKRAAKATKFKPTTRTAQQMRELVGTPSEAFQRALLADELQDLGVKPTAETIDLYMRGDGRQQEVQSNERTKEVESKPRSVRAKIARAAGKTVAQALVARDRVAHARMRTVESLRKGVTVTTQESRARRAQAASQERINRVGESANMLGYFAVGSSGMVEYRTERKAPKHRKRTGQHRAARR